MNKLGLLNSKAVHATATDKYARGDCPFPMQLPSPTQSHIKAILGQQCYTQVKTRDENENTRTRQIA